MRDFTGRELAKLSEVKEGDNIEVRTGVSGVDPGNYVVKSGTWGLHFDTGRNIHYISDLGKTRDWVEDEDYLEGVYNVTPTQEPTVSNPLSEDEMRAFFERMVTTIVGYSKQDGEIKELQASIAEVDDKLSRMSEYVVRLEAQNQNLKDNNAILERNVANRDHTIKELIAERDLYVEQSVENNNTIHGLRDEVKAGTEQVSNLTGHISQLEYAIQEKDHRITELTEQVQLIMEDRDNASNLYSETRDKLVESERKLAAVEAAIRSTQDAFKNVVNF